MRFSCPTPTLRSLVLLSSGNGGNTDAYPWGQAQPERQGPRAGMLRFSSCCSHVRSLLSSGSACSSVQFTKTWPAGQATAGREQDRCRSPQGLWVGTWLRAGQGGLGVPQPEEVGETGLGALCPGYHKGVTWVPTHTAEMGAFSQDATPRLEPLSRG